MRKGAVYVKNRAMHNWIPQRDIKRGHVPATSQDWACVRPDVRLYRALQPVLAWGAGQKFRGHVVTGHLRVSRDCVG